jgi:SpoVK/Ycf46/Vps4 family AAA+-type ATPase
MMIPPNDANTLRHRPAIWAAGFILPRRTNTIHPAPPISALLPAPAAQPASNHYLPHPWSDPFTIHVLTQPLILPWPRAETAAPPSHSSISSSTPTPSANGARDVQWEVGCTAQMLRKLNIIAGQPIEIERIHRGGCGDGTRVLARIYAVDITSQAFRGKRKFLTDNPAEFHDATEITGTHSANIHDDQLNQMNTENKLTSASAAQSHSQSNTTASVGEVSPVLLLPPSLMHSLFSASAPLPLPNSGSPALIVRIRKFLPAVASNQPQLQQMVHTVNNSLLSWLPTASSVTIARISTPASASRAYLSCEAQLTALFTSKLLDAHGQIVTQRRSRIMYCGRETIIAVPAAVNSTPAKNSWLLRPPPNPSHRTPTMNHLSDEHADGDQFDDTEESLTEIVDDTTGDDSSAHGHLLPPSVMRLLFFRIVSVEPAFLSTPQHGGFTPYFLIDPDVTQLIQQGVDRRRVPYELEWFLTNHQPSRNRFMQSAHHRMQRYKESIPSPMHALHTLRATFAKLHSLFLPSLLPSDTMSRSIGGGSLPASLLLSGPRRSCKRLLSSAVASSLGVHYLEVNFFSLLSTRHSDGNEGIASESAVQANLTELFTRARAQAPCILHLRRIQALKNWMQAVQKEKDVLVTTTLQQLMIEANAPISTVDATSTIPANRTSVTNVSTLPTPVLVLGSCESLSSLPVPLRNLFLHSVSLSPPSLEDRKRIVRAITKQPMEDQAEEENIATEESLVESNEEIIDAAVEVSSIDKRAHLTSSPSPPPASVVSSAVAPLTGSSLASLIAQKTAGMNIGELTHFVASVAKVATERAMTEREEKKEEERKQIKLAAKVAAATMSVGGMNSDESKEDESLALSVFSEIEATLAQHTETHSPVHICSADLDRAVALYSARSAAQSGTLATLPNVRWADVGGLENVKKEVMESIELPLKFPHLFANGVKKRAGILLYGPPGTGKTMIAKAVATECHLNFMSVKGPELLNMYIGESERNIRAVFTRARHAKPVVIFFDELDALAPARGQGSDGGGVMDRVVSALLAELDSGSANEGVFVIAATNRPDLIESGLLRPGRLDRCVYLGVSETREQQSNILRALTRKFHLASDVDLDDIVSRCTYTMSGADFYALAADAMLGAMKKKIASMEERVKEEQLKQKQRRAEKANMKATQGIVDVKDTSLSTAVHASPDDEYSDDSDDEPDVTAASLLSSLPPSELTVYVSQSDFEQARRLLKPSLDEEQLLHYKELRHKFSQTHSGGQGHADPTENSSKKEYPLEEGKQSENTNIINNSSNNSATRALIAAAEMRRRSSTLQDKQDPSSETKQRGTPLVAPVASRIKPAAPALLESANDPSLQKSTASVAANLLAAAPPSSDISSSLSSLTEHTFDPRNEWERGGLRQRLAAAAKAAGEEPVVPVLPPSFSSYADSNIGRSNTPTSSPCSMALDIPKSIASARPLKPWERTATIVADAAASNESSTADDAPMVPAVESASITADDGVDNNTTEQSDSNGLPSQQLNGHVAAVDAPMGNGNGTSNHHRNGKHGQHIGKAARGRKKA